MSFLWSGTGLPAATAKVPVLAAQVMLGGLRNSA